MKALAFWKAVTVDQSDLLGRIIALLSEHGIRYCVIGGQAVNAYVEPLVSLDLDLAVAVDQMGTVETLLQQEFNVKRFPHRLNVSLAGSDLRVQVQTDPRYSDFVDRSAAREVLGLVLPVASLEDILRGKIWAAQDPTRRKTKQQKDLLDIARLLEAYPELKAQVPAEILSRLA
ncbi:MAG: nucleotidyl transferase AbiEii/AbiGii toxin family protein [Chloroflexi bacterium]|nr:nucleotidyl transferase AbiEii/AbiGii toxin family protein [Chloroflexota bacterium]